MAAPRSPRPQQKVWPVVRAQDGRTANLRLVTSVLYDNPGLSRADIARLVGLSRVTISELVTELLSSGLAIETGVSSSGKPGKRATSLQFAYRSRSIIAIDMAGSRAVTGALTALDGEIIDRVEYTLEPDKPALDVLIGTIRELAERAPSPVLGVGVGTPGFVGPEPGLVTATNLDWHKLDVRSAIVDAVGLPTQVENDANLAAVAERRFSSAPDDVLRMQISRGVGAGLLLRGQLITGRHGGAGEIGHVVVGRSDRQCSCGKSGCLETYLAVPELRETVASADDRASALADRGRLLGQALAPIVGATDITDVVLGGPTDLLGGAFLEAVRTTLNAATAIEARPPVRVSMSELGGDAVILGATARVLNEQLGVD